MSLWENLLTQMNLGFDTFKKYIDQNLKYNPNFLKQSFWVEGDLRTILNHLIHLHTKKNDLSQAIAYIFEISKDPNIEQPLHLAYELGKLDIAELIFEMTEKLKKESSDNILSQELLLNTPNKKGLTLLHLVIDKRNLQHLNLLIEKGIEVNQVSELREPNESSLLLQGLHYAAKTNFPEAIHPLVEAGGQLFNPCGSLKETPLLLAARLKHIKVIEAIFETQKMLKLNESGNDDRKLADVLWNKENSRNQKAIEVLAEHLKEKKGRHEALTGIAMLLCQGSDVPREAGLRSLLKEYRKELLNEIEIYLRKFPSLTPKFLKKCHDKNQVLHDIIYSKGSWWKPLWYLLGGGIDYTVLNLESLVDENANLSPVLSKKDVLFSTFVKRYKERLCSRHFFNPNSKMLALIKAGEVTTWEEVLCYAEKNPNSRTSGIVGEMKLNIPQEEMNEEEISSNQFSL